MPLAKHAVRFAPFAAFHSYIETLIKTEEKVTDGYEQKHYDEDEL